MQATVDSNLPCIDLFFLISKVLLSRTSTSFYLNWHNRDEDYRLYRRHTNLCQFPLILFIWNITTVIGYDNKEKTSAIPKEALDVPAVADRCYRFIKQAFGSNVFNPWQLKRLDLNHDLHKLKNFLRCKLFDFCQKKLVLPNSLLRYTVGIVGHLSVFK